MILFSPRKLTGFNRRLWVGLLLASLIFYGISWVSLAVWQTFNSAPLRGWDFADRGDLVGESPVEGTFQSIAPLRIKSSPSARLGLNFRGQQISTTLFPQIRIRAQVPETLTMRLLAQCELDAVHYLSAPIEPNRTLNWLDLRLAPLEGTAADNCWHTRVASLSVHFEGSGVAQLDAIDLLGTQAAPRVAIQKLTPELWLAARDERWRQFPGEGIDAPMSPLMALLAAAATLLLALLGMRYLGRQALVENSRLKFRQLLNFGTRAGWLAAAQMTMISGLAIALLAWLQRNTVAFDSDAALRYLLFVPLQQALLFGLLNALARRASGQNLSPLAIGLGFGLLHTPNFALMCFSALAGVLWAEQVKRYSSMSPIIVSHWLLGLALGALASGPTLRNLSVGVRFFG